MIYNDSKVAGDIIEEEILEILQKKDPDSYIDNIGKPNSDWDIYLPNLNYGVEVKGDYKCRFTGNLVVEVRFDDKPSALSKTKAKWWVFVEGVRFIWIKPMRLYRFIEENKYYPVSFVASKDTKSKDAYLVNRDKLVSYIFNDLEEDEGFCQMIPESSILHYNNYTKTAKYI